MRMGVLLIAVGVAGMLVSAFADWIGVGHSGFGLEQLSGLVIGALVTVAGLVKVFFTNTRIFVRVLAGIYVSGILYVGLMPNAFKCRQYKVFMNVGSLDWHDLAVNTMGFIPLGYLLMLSWGNRKNNQRAHLFPRAIAVALVGSLISFFLEFSQYFSIPGRDSNLMDLIANILGTLVGIFIYISTEQRETLGAKG